MQYINFQKKIYIVTLLIVYCFTVCYIIRSGELN